MWVLWLARAELPLDERYYNVFSNDQFKSESRFRYKEENLTLGALWISESSPTMNIWLDPFVSQFQPLYDNGTSDLICEGFLLN